MTIDELAAATGTTSRRIRAFQTLGLVSYPELRGRTGVYGATHRDRVTAIVRLQEQGFSLESLGIMFAALEAGHTLASVLGLPAPAPVSPPTEEVPDTAELYGFAELQEHAGRGVRGQRHPLLSLVPTTMWKQDVAS